jgi:hypothetical protein
MGMLALIEPSLTGAVQKRWLATRDHWSSRETAQNIPEVFLTI